MKSELHCWPARCSPAARMILRVGFLSLLVATPAALHSQVAGSSASASPSLPPTGQLSAKSAATLPSAEVALQGFDELVEEAMKAGRVPGLAISIVKDGKVVLSKGYGVRNPHTNAPMTEDTMFPVFSITKAITAFTAGLLVDDGKLSFDMPIKSYVPTFQMNDPLATSELTIRDFLSHRSGFPDHWFVRYGNKSLTREELFRRLPHLPLTAPIRTRYDYSNFGFAVAGHVIDQVAGVSWEQFTEERVLRPLGMTRSTLSPVRFQADPNHIVGVMFDGEDYVPTPFDPIEPYVTPAGGVYSTAEDFAKWMLVNLSRGRSGENQIITPGTLSQLHRTAIPTHWSNSAERIFFGYALGWNTEVYRGEPHLQHDGGSWGVTTVVGLLPRLGLGVTVFANQDQSRVAHGLMRNVLDRFMGVPPREWVTEELARQHAWEARQSGAGPRQERSRITGTEPSRTLDEYAGIYSHPGYGPITIRLEGDHLIADRTGESAPISHWHFDVFAASSPDPRNLWAPEGNRALLSFIADPTGKISALQISSAGDIIFRKQRDGEQKAK